nr:MAG TPA: hypothetical protein [Caudoviricetes sp.]
MIKYDVLIYEGGNLAAALTDPGVSLISVKGASESDAFDLSEMLCKYGVDLCIIPHEGE